MSVTVVPRGVLAVLWANPRVVQLLYSRGPYSDFQFSVFPWHLLWSFERAHSGAGIWPEGHREASTPGGL